MSQLAKRLVDSLLNEESTPIETVSPDSFTRDNPIIQKGYKSLGFVKQIGDQMCSEIDLAISKIKLRIGPTGVAWLSQQAEECFERALDNMDKSEPEEFSDILPGDHDDTSEDPELENPQADL